MTRLVMKFGGTSVGSAEAIRHVLDIVRQERQQWDEVVVVTSAIRGVTDSLVKLVDSAAKGEAASVDKQIEDLRKRHTSAAREFIDAAQHPAELAHVDSEIDRLLAELNSTCQEIIAAGGADGRLSDASLSMGERLMAQILPVIMQVNDIPAAGVDASHVLVTDYRHQNAQPQFGPSRVNGQRIIDPILAAGQVPVVTGYIGATPEGAITTLGRGGSDYSATYLASVIDADEVWIWTDVNGVMTADPRKIKEAQIMDTISYQEVSEFAHFGAKVLHPRSVEPLLEPKIPLRVCNTFNPVHPGTRINGQRAGGPKHMSAVTSIDGVLVFLPSQHIESLFSLTQQLLTKHFLQEAQPVITVDSHAGKLLCYVVPTTARRTAMTESVEALQAAFSQQDAGADWRAEPISIVAAIGVTDIQQTVQVLNAVKSAKADLLALGHGSPQCSLLAVPPQQALRVMRRLHRMILSIQSNLQYADNDPLCPPTLSVPANRTNKKRGGRSGGKGSNPPHRVIPL